MGVSHTKHYHCKDGTSSCTTVSSHTSFSMGGSSTSSSSSKNGPVSDFFKDTPYEYFLLPAGIGIVPLALEAVTFDEIPLPRGIVVIASLAAIGGISGAVIKFIVEEGGDVKKAGCAALGILCYGEDAYKKIKGWI